MSEETTKRGRGRPKLELDEAELVNYAKLGASNREIAAMLGCSESVIRQRFADLLEKSRSERRTMLRKMQWDAAKAGNAAMLIFLGKNELEQSDKQTIDSQQRVSGTIKHEHTIKPAMSRLMQNPKAFAAAKELHQRISTPDDN